MTNVEDRWGRVRRVRVLAGLTVREAVRRRVVGLALLLALGFVLSLQGLRLLNFGASELHFLTDVGFGAISFFGAVLTVVLSAQLFLGDLESGAARALLAKPVGRGEYVVGRFIGIGVVTTLFCLLGTALLGGQLAWCEAALAASYDEGAELVRGVEFGWVVVAGLAQAMKLLIIAGYVVLVSTYARSGLLATGVGLVVWLAGQVQPLLVAVGSAGRGWATQGSARIVGGVVPDLQRYDLGERILSGAAFDVSGLGLLAAYAACYVGVTLALAVWSFRHRDL